MNADEAREARKLEEHEAEQRTWNLVIWLVFCFFALLIITIGGCVAHSNSYDGLRAQHKVALTDTNNARRIEIANIEVQMSEKINDLVRDGHSPITARCAIRGWGETSDTPCIVAASGGEYHGK